MGVTWLDTCSKYKGTITYVGLDKTHMSYPEHQFLLKIEFPAVATLTEAQKSWGDLA